MNKIDAFFETSFKKFCQNLDTERESKSLKKANLISKVLRYIRHLLIVAVAYVFGLVLLFAIASLVAKAKSEERLSRRYRKVIKKGLLWDSIEYHER